MTTPQVNKPDNTEKSANLNAKIKETWSKLSDEDIKLYNGNRDQFFTKLTEKQSVSKEDGEKKLKEIEASLQNKAA